MKMFALFLYFCKPASKPLTINVICGFIFLLLDLLQFKPWYIKGLIVSIQFNTRCTDLPSLAYFLIWSLNCGHHKSFPCWK